MAKSYLTSGSNSGFGGESDCGSGSGFRKTREDLTDLPRFTSHEELDAAYAAGLITPTDYTLLQNEFLHPTIFEGGQPGYRDPNSNVVQLDADQFAKMALLEYLDPTETKSLATTGSRDALIKRGGAEITNHQPSDNEPASKELMRLPQEKLVSAVDMTRLVKRSGRGSNFLWRFEGIWEAFGAGKISFETYMNEYDAICKVAGVNSTFLKDLSAEVASFSADTLPNPRKSIMKRLWNSLRPRKET